MFELIWQYFLIFIMAATPWLEILIVIPIGIGMGLTPFWVGFFSFIGNFLPIIIIVYSLSKIQQSKWYKQWKEKRAQKKQRKVKVALRHSSSIASHDDANANIEVSSTIESENDTSQKKLTKKDRAISIFHKYGLPGLSFIGPAITGIHLAAVIALSLKADKHRTTAWMGVSLLVWTVFLTIASYYSIDWVITLL